MEVQNQNIRYLIIGVLALIIVGIVIAIIAFNNDSSEESPDPASSQPEESQATEQPADQQIPNSGLTDSGPTDAETPQPTGQPEQQPVEQETPTNTPTDSTSSTDAVVSQSPARYTDYTTAAFNQAVQDNKNVVLFFHASWCPTCRGLDQDIKNGLSRVPANTEIFKVDYDSSGDLKREYNIQYQHTLAFVQGNSPSPAETLQGATFDELLFMVNK